MLKRAVIAPLVLISSIIFGVSSASAAPVLISPATGSVQTGGTVSVSWNLGETPDPNSGQLTFSRVSDGWSYQYGIVSTGSTDSFSLPVANPGSSPKVYSGSFAIPDNYYNVTYDYTTGGGTAFRQVISTNVRIKNATTPPNLISPADDATINAISISYSLPDTPAPSSTTLRIGQVGGSTICTLNLTNLAAATVRTFTLNPATPTNSPEVSSVTGTCTLPDGDYEFELSYADNTGDPAASTVSSPVAIDTVTAAPALTTPASNGVYPGLIAFAYTLPEVPLAASGELTFTGPSISVVHLSNASAGAQGYSLNPKALGDVANTTSIVGDATLADGLYTVRLSYRDALNNPVASSATATNVRVGPVPGLPGGKSGDPTAPPAKQCFVAPKRARFTSKLYKKKVSVSLAGKPAVDGQSIQVSLVKTKNAKVSLTANGKKVKGPKVWITLTDGAQNISARIKYGKKKKTLKLALPKAAC